MIKTAWHCKSIPEIAAYFQTELTQGLTPPVVEKRQQVYQNRLIAAPGKSPGAILLNQFTDTMVLVLLGATLISGIIGAMVDALTIMAIVIINAILGFIQEYRAERSLEALKKLATAYTRVVRGGKVTRIPSEDLVPGDIVILEAGDKVPADIRLFETFALETDESSLTGESVPVEKKGNLELPDDTSLAEQCNMAFMGTTVTRGRGRGIVTSTGMDTVMGEIASLMKETVESMTPLQERLNQLGKVLIMICLGVCFIVTLLGVYRGEELFTMVLAGVSLAVAAIPEGLPAVVTVVLALGVQQMSNRNAIIRKLPAVETLGCTTVVCSDKTGTLTQNQMTVKRVGTADAEYTLSGEGYNSEGHFYNQAGRKINPSLDSTLKLILTVSNNCNNSILEKNAKGYTIHGDPTEAALLVMALKGQANEKFSIVREIPFDSQRKMMSTVIEKDGQYFLLVKGALEKVIELCSMVRKNDRVMAMNKNYIKTFLDVQETWAGDALRILGFAIRPLTSDQADRLSDKELESSLTFLGLCGLIDPPRPGVNKSVGECLRAGIIPIMITGDYPTTARVIATQLGISSSGEVVKGTEIDKLTDSELYHRAISDRVFARVTPQHKNRIVKVLQSKKQVVAMTGDGINDAPALKAADIGIAMGITGTEVTKEASAMVLADDNFATIINAIHAGRAIYDNIRKFIRYLLGGNIGEVLVMFLASLCGMPLPMIPIQLLWINLVTDGFPALALGMEPPEPGIMDRKPRPRGESLFAHHLGWGIFSRGIYIAVVTLTAFMAGVLYTRWEGGQSLALARTMAFTTLVFAQLFYVFECRSEKYSPFELGFFKNIYLVVAVMISVTMQMSVLYIPALQHIFKTVGLTGWQWLLILILPGMKLIWKFILYTFNKLFAWRPDYAKINF